MGEGMNRGQRQVIAEKVSSTIRVLELLGFEYDVSGPKNMRRKGNSSPRVVYVRRGESLLLRVYNNAGGSTWANKADGAPIATIGSIEDLYEYLYDKRSRPSRRSARTKK